MAAPKLLTLSQFAESHPAFPVSALRWLRYRSSGGDANGFAPAFVKVAGRVLIDEGRFFEIVAEQNGGKAA